MAAANTDKFKKLARRWVGQIGSGGVSDDSTTTIPLASTTNLPTDTAVVATINRVDSSGAATPSQEETVIGVVSGSNLINCVRGVEGTAQAHDAGDVVEILVTAKGINDLIDGLLVEHNQDGTHGDITVDTINTIDPDDIVTEAGTQTLTNKTLTSPVMTSPSISSGDLNLPTTGNIQANSVDPYRTITLPAKSWSPTTTAGCAGPTKVEAGTNDIDYDVLDFDASSDERAYINFPMPASYDGGVIQFRVFWTNAAGETADTIEIELSGRSLGNDEAIDQANGTAVEVTDTWIAQNDVHITDWSGDVTLAGTPAGNEYVHLEILRDVSGDDLAGDLRVIAVQIRYKQGQYSD